MPFPSTPAGLEQDLMKRLSRALWPDAAERRRVAKEIREAYWQTYGPAIPRPHPSQWTTSPQAKGPLPPGQVYTVTLIYNEGPMRRHGSKPVLPRQDVGVYSDPMKAKADDVASVLNGLEKDP